VELWELEAREGVRDTLARYVIGTDSGRMEDFLALFPEDGVFVLPDGTSATGPAGIVAMLQEMNQAYKPNEVWAPLYLRHNITTTLIDLVSPTEAKVEAYFVVSTDRGIDHWGRWIDELHKHEDGRWLFHRREVHTESAYPDSWYATSYSKVCAFTPL
jgi:hypothetical protein